MNIRDIIFRQFLEEEETVKKAFRKRFPLLKFFWWTIVFIVAILVIRWFFFCSLKAEYCPLGAESYYLFLIGGAAWLLKMWTLFLHWYGNGVFMTSESLLFIYWEKLFEPKSIRLDYWDLDQIEVVRKGFSSYVGRYADLSFHKISGGDPIIITDIFRPHRTEQVISKNKEIMTDEKNFTEEAALKDLLSGLAIRHVNKNGQPERDTSNLKEVIKNDYEEKKKQKNKINTTEENLSETQKEWLKSTKRIEDIQISKEHHFENEIVEVEKKLDDEGGIEIDL